MNSNWLVCWNFGRKSGEPMRPRPEPPKYAVDRDAREVRRRPIGSVIEPGIVAAAGGARPNAWCTASDVDCDQEMRNSLTIAELRIRVQPPTIALVLMVWLPNADVPVPSTTPPNAPGIWRVRFE